jgi:hypothetical protein
VRFIWIADVRPHAAAPVGEPGEGCTRSKARWSDPRAQAAGERSVSYRKERAVVSHVSEVAEGIHRLTNGVANFYLIEEPGKLVLVDAGAPKDWALFTQAALGQQARSAGPS